MSSSCSISSVSIGPDRPLAVIAGPCVLERHEINVRIGETAREICDSLSLPLVFKASFDKANRTSIRSARGPGLAAGLDELARLREVLGTPVTTDVHEPDQAARVAEVADLLQIPAFLVRQTDLVQACGATGRAVNAKKGQFMAPAEMAHVIAKLEESGCDQMMLTERGTFFGYHRLVNDFIGVGDMMELGRPVCFDVTHSTQLPGAGPSSTGGRPDRAALLAQAAVAAGVHAVFIECHPDPAAAMSDGATALPLDELGPLLRRLAAIRAALDAPTGTPPPPARTSRPARPAR